MNVPPHLTRPHLTDYVYGYIFAIILTAFPFAMVAFGNIARTETIVIVTIFAVIQMGFHIRFFLHYSNERTPLEARIALFFAALMGVVMLAGCIWVMSDLHFRMMP